MAMSGQATGMAAMGVAAPRRTFWWDRGGPVDAQVHPLRAVIFDADTALADVDCGDDVIPKAGLLDLVMSLFLAGIWVAFVTRRDRECAQRMIRHLIGDGLVETIVTSDDLDEPGSDDEPYRLALWELGVKPDCALAVGGSESSMSAAEVPTVLVTDKYGHQFADADDCRQLHRRWGIRRRQPQAA